MWLLAWLPRGSFGWLLMWFKRGSLITKGQFWLVIIVVKKRQFLGG